MWNQILVCLACVCAIHGTILKQLHNGFDVIDILPFSNIHFGVVPNLQYENLVMTFENVRLSSDGCNNITVKIEGDGYIKGTMPLETICTADELNNYVESSPDGFYVIIQTYENMTSGEMNIRFEANGGILVTNVVFFG